MYASPYPQDQFCLALSKVKQWITQWNLRCRWCNTKQSGKNQAKQGYNLMVNVVNSIGPKKAEN